MTYTVKLWKHSLSLVEVEITDISPAWPGDRINPPEEPIIEWEAATGNPLLDSYIDNDASIDIEYVQEQLDEQLKAEGESYEPAINF